MKPSVHSAMTALQYVLKKAIPDDDPIDTDLDLCSRCTACISICPEDARSFSGEAFEAKKPAFEEANSERKECEFIL